MFKMCVGFGILNNGVVDIPHFFLAGSLLAVGTGTFIFKMLGNTLEMEAMSASQGYNVKAEFLKADCA